MTQVAFETSLSPNAALRAAARLFEEHGIDGGKNEARLLMLHALCLTPLDLALGRPAVIGAKGAEAFAQLVGRRLTGEPVARILGAWEFWGLPFRLSAATLIPRPDTETVVDTALALLGDRARSLRILDLGTGSGCLLVALLSECPRAFGIGIDRSFEALATAHGNAAANGVGARAAFVQGDWCAALGGPFDLILSNPPYIASGTIPGLAAEVREHDPVAALDGGPDGLAAYRAIIGSVASRQALLAQDGALVLEIGYDQAEAVARLGTEGGFTRCSLTRDLAEHDRVVTLRPPFVATSSTTKDDR